MIKIAPSILSADFGCLKEEIRSVEQAGADMLHIDVMDGHFVPNITIGPVVVKYIRKASKLPLDVHLMIEDPQEFTEAFCDAGADMLTYHIEAINEHALRKVARKLRQKKIKAGVSLNPGTPLSAIKGVLEDVDLVLVMSVNPGFSGQEFIPEVIPKIAELRPIFKKEISVDGGVNDRTAAGLIRAGADILAAGSFVFGAKDRLQAIERIRNAK